MGSKGGMGGFRVGTPEGRAEGRVMLRSARRKGQQRRLGVVVALVSASRLGDCGGGQGGDERARGRMLRCVFSKPGNDFRNGIHSQTPRAEGGAVDLVGERPEGQRIIHST